MTDIELAALIEQYTGLTDKQSPAYAQAYRLAHAVMTATAEAAAVPEGWKLVPACPYDDEILAFQWQRGYSGQNNCKAVPGSPADRAWLEGRLAASDTPPTLRKDFPSPTEDGQ